MRKGNKGVLRLIADDKSRTGMSAAILLRNINPKLKIGGRLKVASSQFMPRFYLNVDGYRVRPVVNVEIYCQLNNFQLKGAKLRKETEQALANSPILK